MRIGEVAERAGMTTSAIRYYESVGLLPEPERVGGRRRYDDDVLRRLHAIAVARRAGFSLEEVGLLLDGGSGPAGARLGELADRKLAELAALVEDAEGMMRWLRAARSCECPTLDVCPLFADAPA